MQVAVRHRIGALAVDVEFTLSKPWTVLFAPSGAGKTTILRTIAGLIRPDHARIILNDASGPRVLADKAQSIFTPAHMRCLPTVTQNSALFPHLTVAKNVSYGGKPEQDQTQQLLDLCRIRHLAGKMPSQLSGGEQQRVGLARALAAPALAVLLDEPFSGIDGTLKDQLMRDIKAWLQAKHVPVLHVTHDVGEVFAIADEVLLLREGTIVGQGPPEAMLREERKRLLGWLGP